MTIDKDASYYDAGGIEAKLGPELFAGFLLGNVLKSVAAQRAGAA